MVSFQLAQRRTVQDAGTFLGETAAQTGVPTSDVSTVAAQIIRGGLTAVGTVFFLLMVYGGYLWMTARGDETKVEKARNIVIAAVIGVVIIIGAYAVTNFIVGAGIGGIS